jgi:aspartate aminotransferase
MHFAKRMSRLGTETAFEVLAKARALEAQGKQIVHLEIGEPDFDTPENIREAAKKALDQGFTHYGPSAGLPELREALAAHISKNRKINVEAKNVVVTPGGKPVMFYSILACVDEGDEVIYPNPGFPIYESMINFVGSKPVPVALREAKDFRLDVGELADLVTAKTRLVIINSPHNPTGGILTREDLKVVAELATKHDLWVLADEIYCETTYDWPFESITQFPGMAERTILLDGYSKTYAMTGWRLGYGVMPEPLAAHVARLMTNSNSCTATFTQKAGLEAITGPQAAVHEMVAEFKRRRDVIVDGLNAIPGITCKRPLGAFYVFPNITKTGVDCRRLADHFLFDGGVACLAGTCFGQYGEGYIRFSYANSVENIQEALRRIRESLKRIQR